MKVLVACEESQRVCTAFREKGHEAYSCDIIPCSGGHPEWHIQGDALKIINGGKAFRTQEGTYHDTVYWSKWDLIIAHPPCTDLAVSGARWFAQKRADGRQQRSIEFFMKFTDIDCPRVCIENPVGIMSSEWRKPDQIVQPYEYGDPERKRTCLWLKGLQPIKPTNIVEPNLVTYKCKNGKTATFSDFYVHNRGGRSKARSKTFEGIAKAMADQWGDLL